MMQGCVSVGHDTNKACGEGKRVFKLSFLLSPDTLQVLGGIYIYIYIYMYIYEGGVGGGVHFIKQNACQRGILLFQTSTTQWRKECDGNIPSNHTKKESKKVFNL
jgi:hypothetical protein